jgi:hypothetical protein
MPPRPRQSCSGRANSTAAGFAVRVPWLYPPVEGRLAGASGRLI